jgi:hypothetical protein
VKGRKLNKTEIKKQGRLGNKTVKIEELIPDRVLPRGRPMPFCRTEERSKRKKTRKHFQRKKNLFPQKKCVAVPTCSTWELEMNSFQIFLLQNVYFYKKIWL